MGSFVLARMNKTSYINFIIPLTFLLLSTIAGYAQKEASQWVFHQGSILNFNQNPHQISFTNPIGPPAAAVISNRKGELLFYTDGRNIYDSWHNVVPGGNGLSWMVNNSAISGESKIIIPAGINEQKYYLITADASSRFTDSPLGGYTTEFGYKNDTLIAYTEIKVDKNKKVTVVQKDSPLLTKGINLVAATKHANGIDTWLVTAEFNSNKIYSFLFTECGVMPPVITNSSPQHSTNDVCKYLVFSPDGKKLLTHLKFSSIYLFDFDNTTGIVSNPVNIADCGVYWQPAFSPNSRYFYSYDINSSSPKTFHLKRYDVLNQRCDSLVFDELNQGDTSVCRIMSPGIDGKIYFLENNWTRYIGYYDNPDGPLNKANLKFKVYDTNRPGFNDGFGANFPNFISSYFDPNYAAKAKDLVPPEMVKQPRACEGQNLQFKVSRTTSVTEYKWDFGDGTAIDNRQEPTHAYTQAGTYTVEVVIKYTCLTDTLRQQVEIDKAVMPPVGYTVYTCKDASFNAGGNYASYKWSTGETTKSIVVNNPGTYKVQLEDGCGNYESSYHSVKPEPIAYNLVTADGNGKNDNLTFVEYPLPAALQVYDRWGAKVYESEAYRNDWGAGVEAGIYYYQYQLENCPPLKSWVQVIK